MGNLSLNIEATISQNVNKRLLFRQALDNKKTARILILNDAYLKSAKDFLKEAIGVIFLDCSKNELLLRHDYVQEPKLCDALARAYRSLEPIRKLRLNTKVITGMLLLLDQIASLNDESMLDALERLRRLSDEEIFSEIENIKFTYISKSQISFLKIFVESLKTSRIAAFHQLLKTVWSIHSHLMIKGKMRESSNWLHNKGLIIIPASWLRTKTYAQLLLQFGFNDKEVILLLDTSTPKCLFLSQITKFKNDMYISLDKDSDGSVKGNLAYQARNLYISLQSYDSDLLLNWLASHYPSFLENYSIVDFQDAIYKFQYSGFLNSFIGVNDGQLSLIRIESDNTVTHQKFDIKLILDSIQKEKLHKSSDKAILTDVVKKVFEQKLEPLYNKINLINDMLKTLEYKENIFEGDKINEEFQKALDSQDNN